jgi:UDPglucose 6-dehydrogenase
MRAVVIERPGHATLGSLPAPTPGADEVLVRVRAVGFCGSDLSTFRGANPLVSYPRVPGHEIAGVVEAVGAEVQDVARGIGLDNRIGTKFLHAGPGFGGSCFPKDAQALIKTGQDNGAPLRLVEAVLAVNDVRKRAMARKVAAALGGNLRDRTVALLGLTFKPNTDDMREAPSIALVTALQDMGAKVRAYDPAGMEQAKVVLGDGVTYCDGPYTCAEDADALVIVTEWEQFRALDLERLKEVMAQPVLIDLRNIYRPQDVLQHGFIYDSVGRPSPAETLCEPVRQVARIPEVTLQS